MDDKKTNQERNSTVAISAIDSKKLDQFCKNNALSKKEFISVSLAYFIREGINPKTHESPKGEFTKINKRVDQLFSFIKKQEQDLLKPLILEVIKAQNSQSESFKLVNENQVKLQKTVYSESESIKNNISTEIKKVSETSKKQAKDMIYTQEDLKKALEVLAQFMDEKNKKGLLSKLFTK